VHAGESLPVNRRDFFDFCAASTPFAVEDASVIVLETEFI
jgi:hypothetical protein